MHFLTSIMLLVLLLLTALAADKPPRYGGEPKREIITLPSASGKTPGPGPSTQNTMRATSAELQQIETIIQRHGKGSVIKTILTKRAGSITILLGGKMVTSMGSPNPDYVTPQTIAYDLEILGIAATAFDQAVVDENKRLAEQEKARQQMKETQEEAKRREAQKPPPAEDPVLAGINAFCEDKWPTDYRMQEHCRGSQLKGHGEMFDLARAKGFVTGSTLSVKNHPGYEGIIYRCMNRWEKPAMNTYDYRMVAHCIKQEFGAYERTR